MPKGVLALKVSENHCVTQPFFTLKGVLALKVSENRFVTQPFSTLESVLALKVSENRFVTQPFSTPRTLSGGARCRRHAKRAFPVGGRPFSQALAREAHSEISAKYSRVRTMLEVKPYSLS